MRWWATTVYGIVKILKMILITLQKKKERNMKFLRTISVILLASFTLSSLSFGQDLNSFKLAPPSNFSHMKGPEFKEAAQVQLSVRKNLQSLRELNADSIKSLGAKSFAENTVFTKKVSGTINFGEVQECLISGQKIDIESGSFLVEASTANGTIYYSLISRSKDGACAVSVVPERVIIEALRSGKVKFTHESMSAKDKAVIDLYLEHEITTDNNTAIDEWIGKRMDPKNRKDGGYAVNEIWAGYELYQHPDKKIYTEESYKKLCEWIIETLRAIKTSHSGIDLKGIASRVRHTTIVLIPYENESDLPEITIGKIKVKAYAHSSACATYIFVPNRLYSGVELRDWPDELRKYVQAKYMHEVGAFCGLKAEVKDGEAWNALDQAVSNLESRQKIAFSQELYNMAPVNLLDLELRNDYAAGKAISEKSIFTGAMLSVLALAGVGLSSSSPVKGAEAPSVPKPVLEEPKQSEAAVALNKKIEELIKLLGNKDKAVRETTIDKLAKIGQPAVKPLIQALYDKNLDINRDAHQALVKIGKLAVEPLIQALSSWDPNVRCRAAAALGEIKDLKAVGPLIKTLGDELPYYTSTFAEIALSNIGEPAVGQLIDALGNKSWIIRYRVAGILGEIKDIKALEPLKALLLEDDSQNIQRVAREAIEKIQKAHEAKRRDIVPLEGPEGNINTAGEQEAEAAARALTSSGMNLPIPNVGYFTHGSPNNNVLVTPAQNGISINFTQGNLASYAEAGWTYSHPENVSDQDVVLGLTGFIGNDGKAVTITFEDINGKEASFPITGIAQNVEKIVTISISDLRKRINPNKLASVSFSIEGYNVAGSTLQVHGAPILLITSTYYPNGRLQSEVLSSPGQNGVIYRHYRNEKLNRVDMVALAAPDQDGATAYRYLSYFGRTNKPRIRWSFDRINYEQPSNPKPGRRIAEYIYNFDGSLKRKILFPKALAARGPGGEQGSRGASGIQENASNVLTINPIEKAIPDLSRVEGRDRGIVAPNEFGAINDLLWQAATGAITEKEAMDKLAQVAPKVNKNVLATWIAVAKKAGPGRAARTTKPKYAIPSEDDIKGIAARIKGSGIEVFMPKSQFPRDSIIKYRSALEAIGSQLRVYQDVKDLESMIQNPAKSIVMTTGLSESDAALLESLKARSEQLRFMSFAKMEDLNTMSVDEIDNYQAEILGILLVARIITPEDLKDSGNPTYRLLSHLLEAYMPEGLLVDEYIKDIVNNVARLIRTILKALPIEAYKEMRTAVAVLWSV